jgi:hypothetical protein
VWDGKVMYEYWRDVGRSGRGLFTVIYFVHNYVTFTYHFYDMKL